MRSFKTDFHNGDEKGRPIVTFGLTVKNVKKFDKLDKPALKALYECLYSFKGQLKEFMQQIEDRNRK